MRIKILRIIVCGLFLLLICELFYIQVIKGRYYHHLSTNNRIRVVPLEGWRGRILDRNGVFLADNRISYDIAVIPQETESIESVIDYLSQALGESKEKLTRKYKQKRFTPFTPVVIVEDVERSKAFAIEENKYLFPSLFVQKSYRREYPLKANSAHVLGYVGKINRAKMEKFKEYGFSQQRVIGYSGVEEFYDSYLQGSDGGYQIEVNSRGRQVRLLGLKEPTRGVDVQLTIDSRLQESADQLLLGKRGTIIVMDVSNGEILAMTSSPAYDPNVFVNNRLKDRLTGLFSQKSSPFLNRAIKGAYPPGSVFKVPVALAGLDTKKITEHTTFVCNGAHVIGGISFGCTHNHGDQNLNEAIAHSCNVYFYRLAEILGEEVISQYAMEMGLGRLTHIDLPFEESGYIPSRKKRLLAGKGRWYTGDTLNLSIGQGDVQVTPIQLTRLMATVARYGVVVQPHIVKAIGSENLEVKNVQDYVSIPKSIFEKIHRGLRAVVTDYGGTAHVLDIEGLDILGKTGTAQTVKGKEHHAWFAGFTKGTKSDVAFCIFLEHGGSSQNANILARQFFLAMRNQGYF